MRITRKRMLLGLIYLISVTGSTSSYILLTREPSKVNKATFDRIDKRMAVEQVESILEGVPSKAYSEEPEHTITYYGRKIGPRRTIIVVYRNGCLKSKYYNEESIHEFLSRLRENIGL
jgi:hypothetical protein